MDEVSSGLGSGYEAHGSRLIAADCGGVRVVSVYVPNGRSLADPQYQYKLGWLARLGEHVSFLGKSGRPVAVCGDFNIAPGDSDVWDPAAFVGSTHTSPEEREALAGIEDRGLVDVFRARYPDSALYTYWDYRAGDFHEHRGMRIDLLLMSPPLAERVTWALVDRNARKGKLPSDHAPVLVDLSDAG